MDLRLMVNEAVEATSRRGKNAWFALFRPAAAGSESLPAIRHGRKPLIVRILYGRGEGIGNSTAGESVTFHLRGGGARNALL